MKQIKTFEQAENRLLAIVEQLDDPNIAIEQSIELFSEGAKLIDFAGKLLDDAKLRIEELLPEFAQHEEGEE